MHIGSGHVVGELVPIFSAVQSNVQSKFSAQEQKILIDIVFLNVSGKPINVRRCNGSPGGAKVSGFVNVSALVAGLVSCEDRVGIAFSKGTGLNMVNHRAFGKT